MALFEQRISDEQVQAARRKIASGASSLRAAAAEIGCAASTLSVRIKKLEAADADALVRAGLGGSQRPLSRRRRPSEVPASTGEGSSDRLGPIEVLRGALQATKANGQPDWPTRLSAARALAALRPEELEPTQDEAPATVVYDLPPGSAPILHRPRPGAEAPAGEPAPRAEPGVYVFTGGDHVIPLVEHKLSPEGANVRFLKSREHAAELLRAFGGDPACLDTVPDANPQAGTA